MSRRCNWSCFAHCCHLLLILQALPFLAELLEDEDAGVAAAAAGLVSRLEQLTGEGFDDYLKT